ncbi:unnamed protein product [Vitrella brassicaformis CCMP3155]|uniref:AB hydrolase-1 domain-containing protein n=1 Tax=Vitrella brassicaformis (strain CCMP3155) TaxID=1169540 RepID=A0A0G4FAT1_VITBC|nr:unnamed protein product [Vitrella brassicaformis CCMP3155]|eukprot:CEM09753.1 unnamed protein product [Vitrella brassicaformis CCMP3155]
MHLDVLQRAFSGPSAFATAAEEPKSPVLICPAQLGISEDYLDMISELNARGYPAYAVDLKRLDWLELIPSSLTLAYWQGKLEPSKVLQFYYRALRRSVTSVREAHPEQRMHLVGHSIGGWIVRAFLAEEYDDDERASLFTSLTTLGTPHNPPPADSPFAQFDQTRGLLTYIADNYPGAFHSDHINYNSVVGASVKGGLGEGGLEGLLAYASYLALCGEGDTTGDGVVPQSTALLPGSSTMVLEDVKHSGFVPSLGPSIKIPGFRWYGTPDVVDQWIELLERVKTAR